MSDLHEFTPWPKTARLFRDIVVTEKLDGTNSAVHITPLADWEADVLGASTEYNGKPALVRVDGTWAAVSAQSRKRMILPGKTSDNFGFAGWVYDNAGALVRLLGEGLHYGEWWGKGIQRGYGRDSRSFSLFNTERYAGLHAQVGNWDGMPVTLGVVPTLYAGTFDQEAITGALRRLDLDGSVAAPGFATPEGICVYHSASRSVSKVTLDHNDAGKWEITT